MPKIKIPREQMLDILGTDDAIEDEIVDHTRWAVHHEMVFKKDGKFYKTWYSVGATESQDESPWEYEDEVEAVEVEKYEKTVTAWREVE